MTIRKRVFGILLTLAVLGSVGTSMADTAVNTYTTDDQNTPAVAADGQGRFIVVWVSEGQDGDGSGIFGRRFAANGQAIGDEFAVNSYTSGIQNHPQVAADQAGNFVVVWRGRGGADRNDVFGRRFDSTGAPVDSQFQINEDTSLNQATPAVALAEDGSFLAVWSNSDRLAGRHYDELDIPTGGEFEIAVDDASGPYGFRSFHRRDVEALPGGNFVVVWQDHFYSGYGYEYSDSILGAVFDDQALLVTNLNAASGAPAEQQRAPALARSADGGFVVVWGGYTDYASYSRILGRRFSSDGSPQGAIFDPTPEDEMQLIPEDVTAVGSDRFLVIWNEPEIEGRFVATDGSVLGEPFTINNVTAGQDSQPVIATSGSDTAVVWTSDDAGPSMDEIVASFGFPFFSDGFESGDASAWSVASPPLD